AALTEHVRGYCLRAVVNPPLVCAKHDVELLDRHLLDKLTVLYADEQVVAQDARVVDQNIDPAIALDGGIYPALHGLPVGNVHAVEARLATEGGRHRLAACLVHISSDDFCALCREPLGGGPATPRRAAGAQRNLICKAQLGLSPGCDCRRK